MSFLGKGKKADLIKLAIELGEYPEFVKCIFEGIVSNRIDEENKQKEQTLREFELQKIRLQNETQRVVGPQTLPQTKIELKKLLLTFNPEVDNMDLFLTLFERQMKLLDLGEDLSVPYLIGALHSDVTSLIARETEDKCRDYSHIGGMLLQRFKLTAEKFRELFSRHRKSPNGTWKDYYFEIRVYFEGWLNELKIDSFDGLKNLIIAGQMKKKCSSEYIGPRKHVKASETVNDGRQVSFRKPERPPKTEYSHQVPNEKSPLRCYGCGKQGAIKSRFPTCNLNASQRTDVATNHINDYTAQTRSPRLTLIDITFCGIKGRETTLAMSLADGQQTTGEALTTQFCWFGSRCEEYLSYFWDNPTYKYPFGEELDTPSIVEKMSSNTCQLREGEGESLTSAQKTKLKLLLESFQNVFELGVNATNILEHHINTGNSRPISVPPYRMSPVKNCPDCIKYKASNQKPSGLLQTPVPGQRFETLVTDHFGPLPKSKDGKRWILIIEDCTTKWVELFALPNATAKECDITLIEEVLLRSGIPRRLINQ
ncbi:uncharacterized protein TNCV_2873961 [Trichonephila clavipes]|nr:uncharacterized protein TNCV_2873961 [Trichonephila clavipes]